MSTGSVDKNIEKLLHNIYLPLKQKIPVFGRKKKVIVIAGPTASGKTNLSLQIAKLLGGELISADSMQIYKGMDIGTAKPTKKELNEVPHHLIDICEVFERFNVMKYFEYATQSLKEILAKGNAPIIVGGTGFYIHALLYGPPPGPASNPEVRDRLEAQMDKLGADVLYEQLQMLDPEYAHTITEKDRQKIIRALEIIAISEKKVSDFLISTKIQNDEVDWRLWFIYYPKKVLYPKIDIRCDQMIEKGLIDEVKTLMDKGLTENKSAMQAIGYRQCIQFLKTKQTKEDFQEFVFQFKKASRNYAKRQFTWFRKENFFRWIDLSEIDIERAQELILQDFEQN